MLNWFKRVKSEPKIVLPVAVLFCVLTVIIIITCVKVSKTKKESPKNTSTAAVSASVKQDSGSSVGNSQESPVSESGSSQPLADLNSNTGSAHLDPSFTRLMLVNYSHLLDRSYDCNGNRAIIPREYLNVDINEIDGEMWPYLKTMLDAAHKDGVRMLVASPYRPYATQEMLFNRQINRQLQNGLSYQAAEAAAAEVVARPGTSEHQTGLAVDINETEVSFESTPTYKWLDEHGADYGFILRYPKDKEDITKISYEPWHWRFVGINAAKEIKARGMTLEEYCEYKNIK